MEGPPLGLGKEDITWPDQVTPGAERRLVPATSKLKPQTSFRTAATRWKKTHSIIRLVLRDKGGGVPKPHWIPSEKPKAGGNKGQ